jgi:hypothetical protein
MFVKKNRYNQEGNVKELQINRVFPIAGAVSFLTVISLTYLVYLFSQLAYFFSAFNGFLPEGYTRTASAFARRGFFEMFAICAINILIISIISAFSKREGGKPSLAVRLLSLFIFRHATADSLYSLATVMSFAFHLCRLAEHLHHVREAQYSYAEIVRLLSCELEYSEENTEALLDACEGLIL